MSYFYVIWLQDMLVRKRLRRGQNFKFSWTLNMHICNVKPFALKRDLFYLILFHQLKCTITIAIVEIRPLNTEICMLCFTFGIAVHLKGTCSPSIIRHFICLIFTWNMTGKIGQFGILTNYLLIIQPCRFYTIYSAVMGNARFCLQLMIIADND